MGGDHHYFEWVTIWREVNVILSFLTCWAVVRNLHRYRKFWTIQERNVSRGLGLLCLASFAGSLHSLIRNDGFNAGIPFITLAAALLLAGLWRPPTRYEYFQNEMGRLEKLKKEFPDDPR